MIFLNQRGISLVNVIIAGGMVAAMALVLVKLSTNMQSVQNQAVGNSEELEVKNQILMILSSQKNCRISIAGTGAYGSPTPDVVFGKKQNRNELSEGINVEFYYANQSGTGRVKKVLSATDSNYNTMGKISIKELKLVMDTPTGTASENYNESPGHEDVGHIYVTLSKDVNKKERTKKYKFPINVLLKTDSSNKSTIISCSSMDSPGVGSLDCIDKSNITSTVTITPGSGPTDYIGVMETDVSCDSGYQMISCGAKRWTALNYKVAKTSGSSPWLYRGLTSAFPTDTYIDPLTHKCRANNAFLFTGVTSSEAIDLKNQPRSNSLEVMATCCRIK